MHCLPRKITGNMDNFYTFMLKEVPKSGFSISPIYQILTSTLGSSQTLNSIVDKTFIEDPFDLISIRMML